MGVIDWLVCRKHKCAIDMHKSSGSSEEIGYNKFKPNWRNLFEMAQINFSNLV